MTIKNENEFNGNTYHYQQNIEVHLNLNCTPPPAETISKKDLKPSILPWLFENIPKAWPYIKKFVQFLMFWFGIDSS